MDKEIINIIHKPLSDDELRRVVGRDTKIMKYSELSKYDTIEQLLTKPYDFVIILLEESPNSGHWCALLRYSNLYEWFDSYGFPLDYDLTHWLTAAQRAKLHEKKKYLTFLLQGRKHIYNKEKYQEMKDGINTCGSHCAYRCYKFKHDGFDLKTYQKHVKNYCRTYGITPDMLVAEFVYSRLN